MAWRYCGRFFPRVARRNGALQCQATTAWSNADVPCDACGRRSCVEQPRGCGASRRRPAVRGRAVLAQSVARQLDPGRWRAWRSTMTIASLSCTGPQRWSMMKRAPQRTRRKPAAARRPHPCCTLAPTASCWRAGADPARARNGPAPSTAFTYSRRQGRQRLARPAMARTTSKF
jgi:hypothetical protein